MNTNRKNKKNILIVEDDPFMQNLYRKALERDGFTILTALDGQAALEMLPDICVDLVVLDLMLPKIHGLKVLETIREDPNHKNLPVLILSNIYLPEMAQKAMKAGANSGIMKSECSPKILVKIICDILNLPLPGGNQQPEALNNWNPDFLGNKSANSHPVGNGAKAVETAALSEIQNEWVKNWPTDLAKIREHCLNYVKSVGSPESEEHLNNLYGRLRLLSARATMGGCDKISQLSSSLEAMLFQHGFNLKKTMSPSVVQTLVQAVDCLEYLFKTGRTVSVQNSRKTRILLVDDDPVCNMVNDVVLKRANFNPVCVTDGVQALTVLEKSVFENRPFHLIILDVNMPVLTGFEVCEKIRKLTSYKNIPIIFVTHLGDFQSRAKSVLSGSNGFIAKPITPLELIVKALVYLLRAQEDKDSNQTTAAPALEQKLAQRPQTQLRPELVAQPQRLAAPEQTHNVEPGNLTERTQELAAAQAALVELQTQHASVTKQVQKLNESLAAESGRRTTAEQQVAELLAQRTQLEQELAQRTQTQERLPAELAVAQQRRSWRWWNYGRSARA